MLPVHNNTVHVRATIIKYSSSYLEYTFKNHLLFQTHGVGSNDCVSGWFTREESTGCACCVRPSSFPRAKIPGNVAPVKMSRSGKNPTLYPGEIYYKNRHRYVATRSRWSDRRFFDRLHPPLIFLGLDRTLLHAHVLNLQVKL